MESVDCEVIFLSSSWRNRLTDADSDTIGQGYTAALDCLFCDHHATDAGAAQAHLEADHTSVLTALLALDTSFTGLTDKQKSLIHLWQGGARDAVIAAQTGVSTSTLRNQRFALREREREARLLLAILSLSGLSALPRAQAESAGAVGDGVDHFYKNGVLTGMPAKESKRIAVMRRFAALFVPGRTYTTAEVRDLVVPIWPDHATVRRWLVDHRWLHRTPDGCAYWVEQQTPAPEQQGGSPDDHR